MYDPRPVSRYRQRRASRQGQGRTTDLGAIISLENLFLAIAVVILLAVLIMPGAGGRQYVLALCPLCIPALLVVILSHLK